MDVAEAYRVLIEKHNQYGRLFENCCVSYFQPEYDELLRTASISPGSKVLDLGTGTGGLAVTASRRLGQKTRIVGVDILPGWLEIARQKAQRSRLGNLDFKVMNIESLEFPERSFDQVVSNFVLCCSFHYDRVVREAYRVLRPRGRFTYNHFGPHDSILSTLFDRIFSRYKVKVSSENLKKLREAEELQRNLYTRYRDPFVALTTMRDSGFRNVEAKIVYHTHTYASVEDYIDSWWYLGKDDPEFREMGAQNWLAMSKELLSAFHAFRTEDGFEEEIEAVYITGLK